MSERRSYPASASSNASQTHRRNVHSAPAAFSSANTLSQASNLTSGSNTSPVLNSSNAILTGSSSGEQKPTFRDQFEKEEALKSQLKHRPECSTAGDSEPEEPQPKTKRSCTCNLNVDWTFSNVYTSGSTHGRKTIGTGSGAPGACSLM